MTHLDKLIDHIRRHIWTKKPFTKISRLKRREKGKKELRDTLQASNIKL